MRPSTGGGRGTSSALGEARASMAAANDDTCAVPAALCKAHCCESSYPVVAG